MNNLFEQQEEHARSALAHVTLKSKNGSWRVGEV
jgi:hypothetical protein